MTITDPLSIARFWSKVDVGMPAECWPWRGASTPAGYGQFRVYSNGESTHFMAYRLAYELLIGPFPEGLQPDHLCKNPPCCNPSHLDPVTARINVLRSNNAAALNARKTHCVNGHAFDEVNTFLDSGGHRQCRQCKRDIQRRYRERQKDIQITTAGWQQ